MGVSLKGVCGRSGLEPLPGIIHFLSLKLVRSLYVLIPTGQKAYQLASVFSGQFLLECLCKFQGRHVVVGFGFNADIRAVVN